MAKKSAGAVHVSDCNEPLLNYSDGGERESSSIVEGVVDYRGERVIDRTKFGGWRSASLVIVTEIAQTFTYFGITSNLISYLTGPLRQSTAVAAANVNAWVGVMWMLPLLSAFIADSYLGQFRTIIISSLIYIVVLIGRDRCMGRIKEQGSSEILKGLSLLTLSTVLPSLRPPSSSNDRDNNTSCISPSSFQVIFFFSSLYLTAIGNAGYKPCAQAFGANQFDEGNLKECKSKSSFFNWWFFGIFTGSIIAHLILNYIQDYLSWGLGFGIPCLSMAVALIVFLLGTKTYRYTVKEDKENPLLRIAQVFVFAAKNWRTTSSSSTSIIEEEIGGLPHHIGSSHQFKFLEKALLIDKSGEEVDSIRAQGVRCSISQVEDAKAVLRLVPIWITCLIYAVVVAQFNTFFTKQASTMDRSLGPNFQIPAASVQIFNSLSIILFIIIYDCLFVPLARAFTGKPNGITILQRVGGGIFFSIITMVVAAVVEKKRLQTALDYGLIDMPKATVPMSVWWLVPQNVFCGFTSVFAQVGLQEFFYGQVPHGMRTVGLSLFYTLFGTGSFLSSLLISVIEKVTGGSSQRSSWFSDNLNRAHLDYFYWLLAGLSVVQFVAYLYFAKSYLYNRRM